MHIIRKHGRAWKPNIPTAKPVQLQDKICKELPLQGPVSEAGKSRCKQRSPVWGPDLCEPPQGCCHLDPAFLISIHLLTWSSCQQGKTAQSEEPGEAFAKCPSFPLSFPTPSFLSITPHAVFLHYHVKCVLRPPCHSERPGIFSTKNSE